MTELSTNCVGYVVVGQETRSVKNHGWIISALHHQRLPLSCILMPNAQGLPFKEGTGTSAGPHLLLHGERPVDTSYAELGQDAGLGEVQRH